MSQEIKLILQMFKEGKITLDEAEELFKDLRDVKDLAAKKPFQEKFLKILVTEGAKNQVNVNLPIALAEVGLKLIPEDKLQLKNHPIDVKSILRMIDEEVEGELVNVHTTEQGRDVKVRIYIE